MNSVNMPKKANQAIQESHFGWILLKVEIHICPVCYQMNSVYLRRPEVKPEVVSLLKKNVIDKTVTNENNARKTGLVQKFICLIYSHENFMKFQKLQLFFIFFIKNFIIFKWRNYWIWIKFRPEKFLSLSRKSLQRAEQRLNEIWTDQAKDWVSINQRSWEFESFQSKVSLFHFNVVGSGV